MGRIVKTVNHLAVTVDVSYGYLTRGVNCLMRPANRPLLGTSLMGMVAVMATRQRNEVAIVILVRA